MKINRFDPPGMLDDLTDEAHLAAWSDWISGNLDSAAAGRPDVFDHDGPRAQFFNPSMTEIADDQQTLEISWSAFPKVVASSAVSDAQRWRRADSSRDLQDEYCEWSVDRDDNEKITRVSFTCEGPEYWSFLAAVAPEKLLALYRANVHPKVEMSHLFDEQGYNPRNQWNSSTSDGAMHLIQPANTLSAEIELAGGASAVRVIDGRTLTGEQELIKCGRYGEPGRHSDPHIGERVNSLTRGRSDVTLANPVGLYFGDLTTAGWATPDSSDPKSYWKYVRGSAGRQVRAVYEVPSEQGFAVGDITINGKPINFGAQIVDFISIKLVGIACRVGQSTVAPLTGCKVRKPSPGLARHSVDGALRHVQRTR